MKKLYAAVIVGAGCASLSSGCVPLAVYGAVNAIGVPVRSVVVTRPPNGKVFTLEGTIRGRQIGDSELDYKVIGTDITCSGTANAEGGKISCTNGVQMALPSPNEHYGSLNGSFAGQLPDGTVFATGWGRDADKEKLLVMLPAAGRGR